MKGSVALGIKQKDSFLELSNANVDVTRNEDFTVSAETQGRARYAIHRPSLTASVEVRGVAVVDPLARYRAPTTSHGRHQGDAAALDHAPKQAAADQGGQRATVPGEPSQPRRSVDP